MGAILIAILYTLGAAVVMGFIAWLRSPKALELDEFFNEEDELL